MRNHWTHDAGYLKSAAEPLKVERKRTTPLFIINLPKNCNFLESYEKMSNITIFAFFEPVNEPAAISS